MLEQPHGVGGARVADQPACTGLEQPARLRVESTGTREQLAALVRGALRIDILCDFNLRFVVLAMEGQRRAQFGSGEALAPRLHRPATSLVPERGRECRVIEHALKR